MMLPPDALLFVCVLIFVSIHPLFLSLPFSLSFIQYSLLFFFLFLFKCHMMRLPDILLFVHVRIFTFRRPLSVSLSISLFSPSLYFSFSVSTSFPSISCSDVI